MKTIHYVSNTMDLLATNWIFTCTSIQTWQPTGTDDNTILTYQSIEKDHCNVSGANWILETNVVRGPITANGASEDTIYVLLYNISMQLEIFLLVITNDMFTVNYRVARLQPTCRTTSNLHLESFNAEGSTFEGFPIDITPSRNDLYVNRTSSRRWLR